MKLDKEQEILALRIAAYGPEARVDISERARELALAGTLPASVCVVCKENPVPAAAPGELGFCGACFEKIGKLYVDLEMTKGTT